MSDNFMDDLLVEAEQREEQQTEAYFDLVLLEIKKLQDKIAHNFREAGKEINLINEWTLKKNSKLDDRIKFLEMKLEAFIRFRNLKTLEMPNGTIRLRKGRTKIQIYSIEEFLADPYSFELVKIKEDVKPDMDLIKAFINRTGKIPAGVKVVTGNDNEFSYKLRTEEEINGTSETGTGTEQANPYKNAV